MEIWAVLVWQQHRLHQILFTPLSRRMKKARAYIAAMISGKAGRSVSDHMTTSPQYYNELYVDPNHAEVVYSVGHLSPTDLRMAARPGTGYRFKNKHVDDNAMWIDPRNSSHFYIGGDGGVYETWDRAVRPGGMLRTFLLRSFTAEHPIMIYRSTTCAAGTQDNFHVVRLPAGRATPMASATRTGGLPSLCDGFKAQIDPTDANVV